MTARFGRATWSLVVPGGWRAWHDDECATLVDGENIGALQVSAAFKDTAVEDADLRDFAADHLDAGATPRSVTAGDFVGFEIAFDDGRFSWRQWYLRNSRQMLLVTYNCSPGARGHHDATVDATLASFSTTGAP